MTSETLILEDYVHGINYVSPPTLEFKKLKKQKIILNMIFIQKKQMI